MDPIKETQKKYGTRAMALAIVVAMGLIVVGAKAAGKGLVLGTLFSIINFVLIGSTLPWLMGREKRATLLVSFASRLIRYALLAVPLVLAIQFDQFDLITAVIGIFMVQLVILLDYFPLPLGQKRTSG